MKVVTLAGLDFRDACGRLAAKVSQVYVPDLVVAIATGGVHVADAMYDAAAAVPRADVCLRRQSSGRKDRAGLLFAILRHLPVRVTDWLRIAEARRLARRSPAAPRRIILDPDVRRAVGKASRVLIVDDAVDSGCTLRDVVAAIAAEPGDRQVRSAVITVTTDFPVAVPDFALYRDSTLIRFPWSKDMKK